MVLGGEASVHQIAIRVPPLIQTSIVEQLEFVSNDERYDIVCQTFLEHQQATYAAITVLKGMNPLEAYMEIDNVFQCLSPNVTVAANQTLHLLMNLLGRASFQTSHLVRQPLVFAHGKPVLTTIRRSRLQHKV